MTKLNIILDTNILISEQSFSSRQMRSLRNFAVESDSRIVLLGTVLAELEAHQHRAVREQVGKIASVVRNSYSHKLGVQPAVDQDVLISDTIKALVQDRQQYTKWFCVQLHDPMPSAYEGAFKRAIARNKPAKASGEGMRDAIIWECVLELLKKSDETVVFISANTTDFADSSHQKLDQTLQSEVRALGKTLAYYTSLEAFLKHVLEPASSVTLEWVGENLNHAEIEAHITQWVADNTPRRTWDDYNSFKPYKESLKKLYDLDGIDSTESISCSSINLETAYAWHAPDGEITVVFEVVSFIEADLLLGRRYNLSWREVTETLEIRETWRIDPANEDEIEDLVPSSAVEQGWAELNFKFSALVRDGRIEAIEIVNVDSI